MMSQSRKNGSISRIVVQQPFYQRQWLKKHGKSAMLNFPDLVKSKLNQYFRSLDQDGNQTINCGELEDPLLLFGLCENKKEVEDLFACMDFDGSGELQFKEFLEVFRRAKGENKATRPCKAMHKCHETRYRDFTNSLLGAKRKLQADVSFRLGMSIYRRKNIINAITSKNLVDRDRGKGILTKFQQQVSKNKDLSSALKEEKQKQHLFLPPLKPYRVSESNAHRRVNTTTT